VLRVFSFTFDAGQFGAPFDRRESSGSLGYLVTFLQYQPRLPSRPRKNRMMAIANGGILAMGSIPEQESGFGVCFLAFICFPKGLRFQV